MGEIIMKKFVIFSLIALVITALHANGACLLQDMQKKNMAKTTEPKYLILSN